jgi:hypothetical protein
LGLGFSLKFGLRGEKYKKKLKKFHFLCLKREKVGIYKLTAHFGRRVRNEKGIMFVCVSRRREQTKMTANKLLKTNNWKILPGGGAPNIIPKTPKTNVISTSDIQRSAKQSP